MREAVLVSNGPGELYTWARPVLEALRRLEPGLKISLCLIPCQFASGHEAEIARGFGADVVTTPAQYLRAAAVGSLPPGVGGDGVDGGFVISLGGNPGMAADLARKLGYPLYRYSFEPGFHRALRLLFVPDERTRARARRLGAPDQRVRVAGNLVADAVGLDAPAADAGTPHVLVMAGSRDTFAVHLLPFYLAVLDRLAPGLPGARFVWPVSRMLRAETLADGIRGRERATLGGIAGRREGDRILTPSGAALELVPEEARYAHMHVADLALTIPGTNTLELGVAGVPAVVLLPLNRPEIIPLEGIGHWLGLLPLVGRYLKRYAVRLFVEGLKVPVSLPNRFSGEPLMRELTGRLDAPTVAEAVLALLHDPDDLARRRARLRDTMPRRGAAEALGRALLDDAAQDAAAPRTPALP